MDGRRGLREYHWHYVYVLAFTHAEPAAERVPGESPPAAESPTQCHPEPKACGHTGGGMRGMDLL